MMADTKLKGQLYDHRIRGILNTVPSSGSVLLQAKTAYPSHDEQVIMPDDDYQGLSLVKVMPVPRLPACVASLEVGADAEFEMAVNLAVGVSITAEDYKEPATHAFYNGVRLPIIPGDVLKNYPYATIILRTNGTYRLLVSQNGFRHDVDALLAIDMATNPSYLCSDDLTIWSVEDIGAGRWSYAELVWSNNDILEMGTTDVYFAASEPVLDE